ncbi:hypothetical protein BX666DRAFT_1997855 [Dichotomocladium elegans]|nr:hypothetical protein BX666DRAFT_1997855 [Dichotomocladium elegans]
MLLQEQNGDAYSLIHERLTGTKLVSLDEQSFALTGIQGYPGPQRVLSDEATESQVSELSPMMLQGRIFGNDDDDDYAYRRDGPFEDSHRSWLVQDPDRGGDNFRKPNDDDEEVPLFTLSGLRRASAPEKALQIVQVPPDRMEEHDPAPDKSPTELPIVRAPATPYSSRMHTISIVEDWSPLKYQQDFATFEPVILSGLQTDKDAFEIAARSSSSLIGIVQTHVAEEQEQAPFALSGLRRSSYITSKSQQSSSADVEPVVLSGLLRQDEYFVRESSAAKDAFEFVGFAGSDEEEQGSSDEEPHTPTNLAPVALTGIRATGSPFAGFVEDPSPSVGHASAVDDDDVVVDLEPVLLSGLRTDRAYAGIVQEPTSPAPQSPALTEHDPSGAAGIRGSHLLYTGFVQTPQDFGHNDHAPALGLERVVLSGIQVDLEEDPREEMSLLGVVAPLQQLQLHGVREGTEVPSPPRAMPIVEEASFEPSPRSIIATAVPEQIRLTGISESESEVPLKNWLNTDALPGTLRAPAASQSGPYAEAGASIPDDYIEERPEEEIVPDTGNGSISVAPDAAMPPPPPPLLKNWLNMDALPGTISDYAVYEKPTPTDDNNNNDDGMDTKAAQLRNWLQTGHLQGVVPAADAAQEEPTQAVYANPNVSMPDDNDNEVMLAESRRPLSGTAVVVTDEDHADAVALRNLLSLAPQPSADEQSPDMVCKDKDEQHPSRADDTWNDANSHSSTPDAGHALSPPSPKDTPLKHEHLHLTWPALAEIVDQKEE